MKKNILIYLALFLGMNISLSGQILNVEYTMQQLNNWCWAGSSDCILRFYEKPVIQCEIAEYARSRNTETFGTQNCCDNIDSLSPCNKYNYNAGADGSIQDILIHFAGVQSDSKKSPMTKTELSYNFGLGRPIVIRWGYPNGGGHFLVGHGLEGNAMYFMDPWPGEGLKISTYEQVLQGDRTTWTHTSTLYTSPSFGIPAKPDSISGPTSLCKGSKAITYSIPELDSVDSYTWRLSSGATGSSNSNQITVDFDDETSFVEISVKGNNSHASGETRVIEVLLLNQPKTPSITLGENNLLTSSATLGNQWYNEAGPIEGETQKTYSATENGSYFTIVNLEGCPSDTSNIVHVGGSAVQLPNATNSQLYPNPVYDELSIELDELMAEKFSFEIYNAQAQTVLRGESATKNTIVSMKAMPAGIYFIKIQNGEQAFVRKLMKVDR